MTKTNNNIIKAIENWQTSGEFHKLTCHTGDCKEELFGVIENNSVVLKCKNKHTQNTIPKVVIDFFNSLTNNVS